MHRGVRSYANPVDGGSRLIEQHAALLERCIRRLVLRTGVRDRDDDLWVAAALALVDAAKRFEPARAVKFETYAEARINGAMLDEMRRMDHLPRRLRARASEVEAARKRLRQRLHEEPTTEQVCEEAGLDAQTLATLDAASGPLLDVDQGAAVPSAQPDVTASIERRELKQSMTLAIARLPPRLQTLVSLIYVEELTYREIGQILDISEPRVCQLHSQAMALLRKDVKAAA